MSAVTLSSPPHSPALSSSPSPPSGTLSPEEEIAQLLREAEQTGFDENHGSLLSSGSAGGWDDSLGTAITSTGPVRNELSHARRLATQFKLTPYQREQLDAFVSAPPLIREIRMFIQQCSLENKMDNIVTHTPAYEISDALRSNIKSVVVAILLSLKLSAYKGEAPKESVLRFLLREGLHIPANYNTDLHISETIESEIGEELTQTRSKFKKMIMASIKSKIRLYDLAQRVIKDTNCTVTVGLYGKLALLRKVLCSDKSATFWDTVDARLAMIRKMCDGDELKIGNVFGGFIRQDKETYTQGSNTQEAQVPEIPNVWQQSVDESLTGDADPAA